MKGIEYQIGDRVVCTRLRPGLNNKPALKVGGTGKIRDIIGGESSLGPTYYVVDFDDLQGLENPVCMKAYEIQRRNTQDE